MRLTKAKQKQLDEAYDTLIQVCLYDRPLKDMEPFLADDVMNFGAGRKELTKTKAAFLKQIKNQKKLAAGLKMDFQIKPVLRKIINKGDGAIYTDDIVNTVWVSDVKNKLQFRLSFIFEYRDRKWIMVHSHTSTPDSQRSDDEIWPVEELKKRTAVLEKSLDEKIAELEIKNRELEIEAALERVRARTMAMHKSEELREAVRVIYQQLQHLGFDSNACNIIIIDKESGNMQYWVSGFTQEIFPEGYYVPYLPHPYHEELLAASRQNKKYDVMEYSGEMKKRFDDIFFTQTDFRKIPEEAKTFMKALESVKLSTAFFTYGALQVLGPAEITRERSKILERFAKVFDLTYTRFLDLQKAEAQAREAKIEAALEKVRARTMAMQQSIELGTAAALMFQQVQSFGVASFSCGFNIWEPDDISITSYMAKPDGTFEAASGSRLPHTEHPHFIQSYEARKRGEEFFVLEAGGKELEDTYRYMFSLPDFKKWFDDWKDSGFPVPTFQISHYVFFQQGYLLFITYQPVPEMWDIFKRFGKVFEQTYTRFLDLQKAEAQAREAKIEAALEKVRSHSLAMHKSDELKDIVTVVFEKLKELDIAVDGGVTISIYPEGTKDQIQWVASPDLVSATAFHLPYSEDKIVSDHLNAKENGVDFFARTYPFEEKNAMCTYLFEHTDFRWLPDEVKNMVLAAESYSHSIAFAKNSSIFINNFFGKLASENEATVLKRFAKVFDQAYVRFLDLQKAEAQAREAQIEAALERVRSRTMAMHRSEEIADILGKMFEELKRLDMVLVRVLIWIFNHEEKYISWWSANAEVASTANSYRVDYNEHPVFLSVLEAWQKKVPLKLYTLSGAEKDSWQDHLFNNTGLSKLPDMVQKGMRSEGTIFTTSAISDYGLLMSGSLEPLSDENTDIIQRFGRVFQQSYTRYTDVQKAEAQAREAQIQLSLERVRASAMAMHHSDELSDVLSILFEQFDILDIRPVDAHLDLFDLEKNTFSYRATGKEGKRVIAEQIVEIDSRPEWQSLLERWKKGKPNTVGFSYYPKEVIPVLMTFFPDIWAAMPEDAIMSPEDFPDGIFDALGYCKFGYIGFHHYRQATEEEKNILIRFANEFERLYQRFLDLQKAEAQAREAQIEAAMEKIRSRSLAMHHSNELKDVINTMYQKLGELKVVHSTVAIQLFNFETKDSIIWPRNTLQEEPPKVSLPYDKKIMKENTCHRDLWQAMEKGEIIFNKVYSKKKKDRWFQYIFANNDIGIIEKHSRQFILQSETYTVCFIPEKNSALIADSFDGSLFSEEDFKVLRRAAKVFDQAYTRFLDLQKAEAQTRESQIELGLERVRARAMAMQKSDELSELVDSVFKELTKLDFALTWCIINIIDEPSLSNTVWAASPDINKAPESYHMLFEDYPFHHAMMKGWKERQTKCVYVLEGKEKKVYDEYLFSETEFRRVPAAAQAASRAMEKYVVTFTFSNFGGLQTVGDTPLSEANLDILSRFGKVFDLTYTRFNDLKQAEAQARESQIQLALERVRAKTMAMHKSDELMEAANLLFQQVQSLGIPVWGCGYNIWEKGEKVCTGWMSVQGSIQPSFRIPLTEHRTFIHMYESRLKAEPFYVEEVSGEELADHYRYMFSLADFREIAMKQLQGGDFPLPLSQIHHVFNFKHGNLIFLSAEAIPGAWDIFKRFTAVFEQTYTRFLDLQKAEAQAREAQIEAALEKVRSRSLAMHTANELGEVVTVIVEKLKDLGVVLDANGVVLCTYFQNSKDVLHWIVSPDYSMAGSYLLPYFDHPIFNAAWQSKENGEEYFSRAFSIVEKNSFFEHAFKHSDYRYFPDEFKQWIFQNDQHILSFAWQKNSAILIPSHTGVLPSEEDIAILKRFAKVFEQSYVRFLDLQKAEAQAREAQIVAALEKVRSRSLAMHKSDELKDVVSVVFEKLRELNVAMDSACFLTFTEGDKGYTAWAANPDLFSVTSAHVPYFDDPIIKTIHNARNTGGAFIAETWTFEEKNSHWEYLFEHSDWKHVPDDLKTAIREFEGWGFTGPITKNSATLLVSYSEKLFSEQENEIVKRFGNVFDQAYIRFLDLQKAETQAREAQIELGLERVRARAMAMQRSDELKELIATVSAELGKLDLVLDRCFIHTYDSKSSGSTWWMANPETPAEGIGLFVKYHEHSPYLAYLDAWHNRAMKWQYILEGKVKKAWDEFLFVETELSRLPRLVIENMRAKEKVYLTASFNNFGCLTLATLEPLSDEQFDIMLRFAKVFDLTYTRFNDLQKAEAQAREAQIELGLERVRARAMAMQNSDELKELIGTVFIELTKLDIVLTRCLIMIYDTVSNDSIWWMANSEAPADPIGLRIKYHEHAPYLAYINAWREKNLKWVYVLEGADKKSWDDFLFVETELSHLPDFVIDGMKAPNRVYLNSSFNTFGNLTLASLDPLSNEHFDILLRFAKVFDLTYTRFNDLQKAEAQARDAQIEAALERVRANVMAMKTSGDLNETSLVFGEQLRKLGIDWQLSYFWLIEEDKDDNTFWITWPDNQTSTTIYSLAEADESFRECIIAWQQQVKIHLSYIPVSDVPAWLNTFERITKDAGGAALEIMTPENFRDGVYYYDAMIKFGSFGILTNRVITEDEKNIQYRFAVEFERAYTRFLDLQKAEAQAKEAQIEAALERVRSRTMAMHKSDELLEVITVVSGQLLQLNFKFDNVSFGENNADYDIKFWMSIKARPHPILCHAPYVDNPIINRVKEAQKRGRGYLFSDILTQEENQQWILHLYNNADVSFPEEIKNFLLKSPGYSRTVIILNNIFFFMGNYSAAPYTDEENSIFSRFANVFEQSYTRFLDLQKAEAQAREAQVEAALERVRAKAMAMHSSEDLSETIKVFYHQLGSLSITPRRCGVGLIDKESHKVELSTMNTTEGGDSIESVGTLKLIGHPVLEGIYDHWLLQKEYHPVLRGNEIKEYYQIIRPQIAYPEYSSDTAQYGYFFFFNEGGVYAWTEKEMTDDELQICRRFTTVLSLTYKRYKDLQQAEANAREAQVEAALERVRAKAMAMHNSADLAETIKVFYQQMGLLNLMPRRCGVGLIDKETHIADLTGMIISEQGETKEIAGKLKLADHPVLLNVYGNWLLQNEYHPVLRGNEIKEYYELIGSQVSFKNFPDDSVQFGYFFFFPEGAVYAWTEKEFTEDELKIYRRFTSVLSLTYKRYKDLKQAEAQAREAKIEAAMEKVRARAMAMQKPNELIEVAELLRKEMGLLGVEELETSSIYIHNEASGKTECWFAIKDDLHEKKLIADHMTIDLTETGVGRQMMEFYRSDKKQISIVMQGAKRKEWINYCADHAKVFGSSGYYGDNIPDRTYHLYKFSNGYMGAASPGDISAESWGLLQRATTVFSLAYTRFNDLQQAETSAREAVKQAALDRVRAEIASMRTVSDLDKITPLIWNELTVLGIPFIRCGVFIMDESQKLIHTFLSTPDGKAIGAFHLPYDTPNMVKILDHWREKNRYIDHWDEIIFTEFADTLVKQGALASPEQYLKTIPHGGFYLHFLPFLQGMLYVGNTNQLGEDEIKLIQSVADAFSTAYARYEDFNKLEVAKQQVDKTLTDLKQAQTQLVQSEKMASLGELTAGIAHEIQNPLNFVNNFSDVSNELLDEMKGELAIGNMQQAIEIADDVKQNLEKILHHGKRADAIVKGMLQHSRASSGQKEPTDINILADEYLRLAYHGLRAKDKSFNAKFETMFDDRIGKINIIPQEIGRVILNLINNGFYAVSEKKKLVAAGYDPTVVISTLKDNGKVEIKVRDNGIGIPQKMLDKIFQPFFTTKPTGEGTGLGLSLAYDIVKAHGGELKVETKEGQGSEFILSLPG